MTLCVEKKDWSTKKELDWSSVIHMDDKEKSEINVISNQVIGAAIEVHRNLGPGLLESAYEECLCQELGLRGLSFERQKPMPIVYKNIEIENSYRLDMVVEGKIIIEVKAAANLLPIHDAQLLTYLRLSNLWLGLLINFNVIVLRDGIRRIING
jgi:GxxExxY protein